jgi:hypothetical protein
MKIFIEFLAVFCIICATVSMAMGGDDPADPLDQYATDPLNATYLIEGQAVRLTAGYCELPAAPGSAMKSRTAVWGQPVYGDMDDDGDTDAALLFTHDPGGSATFYYIAAAINVNGSYQGTNAILLGDRIGSVEITIRSAAAVVKYADRRSKEPMSAAPSVNKSTVLILKNEKLIKIRQFGEGDQIFEGWVTIGHEVRSFLPCSRKKALWLMGKWFFEGDFPIVLTDSDGKVIAKGYATAEDEWMTNNFVPFESEISFNTPTSGIRGTLILKKDNPTDLPEHDDELEIVIYFEYQDSMGADPWQKITFDVSELDESGLYGPPDGKRALSYEFCIPDTVQHRTEVKRIDPTVKFFAESPGRIGCKENENLCIGSTHQKDFRGVLQRLAELTYVQRIDESFFE